jgi:4-diphosphocytidyl-2-C-methyl-D-erythritol kinase
VRRAPPGPTLRVEGGGELGPPERNLVVRAAREFCAEAGFQPALEIELVKRIPAAAGMGGGSSDAAATLRALNYLFGDLLSHAALLQIGARLGSDVPFFLCGSPLALGWGRGERLLALPALRPRPFVVVHPGTAVPTPEAFRRLAELRAAGDTSTGFEARALSSETLLDWRGVAPLAANDFEAVVLERIPRLAEVRARCREAGAEIALLSGSGAAFFAVFADEQQRDAAHQALQPLGLALWRATSLQAWPEPARVNG